jgi:large subunit ribosomal protein L23
MAQIPIYEVIRRPVITEKSTFQAGELNQFTFEVHPKATKVQVREAVEIIFDVDVEKVNVAVVPAKRGQRWRRSYIRKSQWKKAIVTVSEGQNIPLFEM